MTRVAGQPRRADQIVQKSPIRFSICTLVTDHQEYDEMVRSFRDHGFGESDCEYLFLDNSNGNAFDAFTGVNIFLRQAVGDYVILCHQDVILLDDDRGTLESRMAELDALDPKWALCGNGGGTASGERVIRVSDPHGPNQAWGTFPTRVTALDENFIVVRADANLAVSHDLNGFHLYGADLCIVADVLGRSAWVVDFHLLHKSPGNADSAFSAAVKRMQKKYGRAFAARPITTTCTNFELRGGRGRNLLSRILPSS